MTLERIVRPFQSSDVFTQSRLSPSSSNPTVDLPDDVSVTWEGAADSDFVDEGLAWYIGLTTDLKEDKTQRDSKTVKIVNPDDPDDGSKLYVERINKTTFKTSDGKELKLEMDWTNPKDQAT